VLVDAVVTGAGGEPIHGLTAKDFAILEDGKEQAITGFQTHSGPAVPEISQQQRFVLLFAPQSADAQKWIQQAAAGFIAGNAGPSRLMSIFFADVCYNTISSPFSDDAGRLQQVLAAWPDLLHCDRVLDPTGAMQPLYYAQLAKSLARAPGHKVVVLFLATAGPAAAAAGKPPETFPAARRAPARGEKTTAEHQDPFDMELEFRKADVSVYPIEPLAGTAAPAWALALAEATGGRELAHGSDAAGVFDPLTREQDESYTLAYMPKPSPEGSCHALKVTVNRPGVNVRARNLYCNARPVAVAAAPKPQENELERLAESAEAGNTAASAAVPFFYEPNGVARVNVAIEIPSPDLEPAELNGKLHAEMDVLGLAYVPGGDVAARFTNKVKFDFDSRQQFDDFARRPFHYEKQFEVLPGNYQFKAVFRSAKDKFGVVEAPLAVDSFNNAQLSLSAIALSRNVQPISPEDAQEEAEAGKTPLIFRGNRVSVSGSDVLPKAGTAEAYFEIYEPLANPAGTVQLTMRLRVLDAKSSEQRWISGDVDLSALAKSASHVIPVAIKLPVATLPPGTYRAELTVKDSAGGQAVRSIEFRAE
jgi:VWFA-related protein